MPILVQKHLSVAAIPTYDQFTTITCRNYDKLWWEKALKRRICSPRELRKNKISYIVDQTTCEKRKASQVVLFFNKSRNTGVWGLFGTLWKPEIPTMGRSYNKNSLEGWNMLRIRACESYIQLYCQQTICFTASSTTVDTVYGSTSSNAVKAVLLYPVI